MSILSFLTKKPAGFLNHVTLIGAGLLLSQALNAQESFEETLSLSLNDLLSMKVTSVSKKSQALNEVASAIFVISQDDIARSGVTSIPEALRMAPGIQVSRIDANKWSITSRGFAQQFANKLLVLIDGRSVYTPSFSGVYWDIQDTVLSDIERIEVIRGPGATVWGANAVNGVINIITKESSATHNGLFTAGAGNEEKGLASIRYGVKLNSKTDGRIYLKYNKRDSSVLSDSALTFNSPTPNDANDHWRNLRGGFRTDIQTNPANLWTIQGNAYEVQANQLLDLTRDPANPTNFIYAPTFLTTEVTSPINANGWNILGKWEHQIDSLANTSLQLYYDETKRSEEFNEQHHETFDIEFQHQLAPKKNHEFIWGVNYRSIQSDFENTFNIAITPKNLNLKVFSAFIQDEVELITDKLRLTLGSKVENYDFTGTNFLPNIRLAWLINHRNTLWGAVSKAIRSPSRTENGSTIVNFVLPLPPPLSPTPVSTFGSEDFASEELIAWEVGYRIQATESFSADLAIFYNDYDQLLTAEPVSSSPFILDTVFDNKMSAQSYGAEISVLFQPKEWLRFQSNYSYIKLNATLDRDSLDPGYSERIVEGASPTHQFSLRASLDISKTWSSDFWIYHVDELKNTNHLVVPIPIPAYTSFNANLKWQPSDDLSFNLVGQNLFDPQHLEFIAESFLNHTEVERSIYLKMQLSF